MIAMNVRQDECLALLNEKGEEYIYQCLAGVDSAHIDLHIYNCSVVMIQFAKGEAGANIRAEKFWYGLDRMGISPEEARNRVEKLIAIGKMFGI